MLRCSPGLRLAVRRDQQGRIHVQSVESCTFRRPKPLSESLLGTHVHCRPSHFLPLRRLVPRRASRTDLRFERRGARAHTATGAGGDGCRLVVGAARGTRGSASAAGLAGWSAGGGLACIDSSASCRRVSLRVLDGRPFEARVVVDVLVRDVHHEAIVCVRL